MKKIKLNDLEVIEKEIEQKDLSPKDKFTLWKNERRNNFDKIVNFVNKNNLHHFDENGILIIKGETKLTHPCPPRIMINDTNFYLHQVFTAKISMTRIVIYYGDVEIFGIPFQKVKSFYWSGL